MGKQTKENIFLQNIALFVFDIEFYKNHCTSDLLFNYLETFFSSGIYFKYDVLSNKSAYEQLLPSIIDCQLNNVMISAPSTNELFNEVIKSSAKQLFFKITMLIIFVISFIIMSVYVSELYFYNNSKKLVIKYLNGHSLSYILIYIITLKLICYPIILKISDSTTFGVIYCLLMIIIDILNPEMIIIGSVFARSKHLLLNSALEEIEKESLVSSAKCCEIVPAKLGERIGDYAALSVATIGE